MSSAQGFLGNVGSPSCELVECDRAGCDMIAKGLYVGSESSIVFVVPDVCSCQVGGCQMR